MSRMSVRATYALDEVTARRIKQLAQAWGVSQAEVIRRSVKQSSETEVANVMSPSDVIRHYAANPPLRTPAETKRIVAELRSSRQREERLRDKRNRS